MKLPEFDCPGLLISELVCVLVSGAPLKRGDCAFVRDGTSRARSKKKERSAFRSRNVISEDHVRRESLLIRSPPKSNEVITIHSSPHMTRIKSTVSHAASIAEIKDSLNSMLHRRLPSS